MDGHRERDSVRDVRGDYREINKREGSGDLRDGQREK